MKQIFICVFLFSFIRITLGQSDLRFVDIRSAGMGGNGVTGSALLNPACLSLSTSQSIDINYYNKYGLKELASASVLYVCPSFPLPFAFNVSAFGYNKYRETMFRLSLAKAVSSTIVLGISTQYAMLQTDLYTEEARKLSTDVGILFISGDDLLIGLSITDLPSVRMDDKSIHIEDFNYYSIQAGFNRRFMNNLLIAASACYTEPGRVRMEMGLEYVAYDSFSVRAGFHTNPLMPAFGAGLLSSAFWMNVSAEYHYQLGVCPGVGLTYFF